MKNHLYTVSGIVKEGKKRGKALGFPTANLSAQSDINQGVYVSQTTVGNQVLPSVTFVGKAETFNEDEVLIETHILNFDQNIYNKEIKVELLEFIRGSKKFEVVKDLIVAIKSDINKTKEYFKKH